VVVVMVIVVAISTVIASTEKEPVKEQPLYTDYYLGDSPLYHDHDHHHPFINQPILPRASSPTYNNKCSNHQRKKMNEGVAIHREGEQTSPR